MLHARPKGWFSWDVDVYDESGLVGEIVVGSRFVVSVLTVGDEAYAARVSGWMSDRYSMESNDVVVARARATRFHSRLVVEYSGAQYTLRSRGFWSKAVDLVREITVVGSVVRTTIFRWWGGATADFPSELPVQIRFFIIWLVLISSKFDRL
jgi:hypothetical protein